MKAVVYNRYGPPDGLRLTDVPIPEPGRGELRLRVLACAVNLSDWEYLTGTPFYARIVGGLLRPKRPILGSDIVGEVDVCGSGVTGFGRGQRVMGDFVMTRGGFAEFTCVPADHAVPVPDVLSDEIAACLPQAGGIAVSGADGLTQGTRFLINGAGGGSGTLALQLAKAAGAHVTAVDNAGKTDWLATLGADAVIDYGTTDFTGTGQRWDRILDMVATRGACEIARAVAPGGTYHATGGRVSVLLRLVLGGLLCRNRSIGLLLVPSGRALTDRVARLAAAGALSPYVEAVLPLGAVPEAIRRTGEGAVRGKIVIVP